MRPTKISKYFEVKRNDPLFFCPTKKEEEQAKPKPLQAFDQFSVQLLTKYDPSKNSTLYDLKFPNHNKYDVSSTIEKVNDSTEGDLEALQESLTYLVYHPNLSQTFKRYQLHLTTNSMLLSNIQHPTRSLMVNHSKIYLKIQSLLNCIPHAPIEYYSDTLAKKECYV